MLKLLIVFLVIFLPFNKTTEFEKTCIAEVNQLRKEVGTQPLKLDPKLTAKCKRYAKKLARTGRFEHDPRLKYNVGENIAMSTSSKNPIMIWANSAGHYRNMVDRDFKKVGVAMATNGKEWYYVMRLK